MTTATVARPHYGFAESSGRASDFTGTLHLLRLYLRRDRIVLPLWVLLFSLPLGSTYVKSTEKVYPTPQQLDSFAHTILSSPAQLAMYGPVYNTTSAAAVGLWKAGMFFTLIGIATILTVIRHTRAEEETGREELLASTQVGRFASLTAALVVACGGALAAGLLGAASIKGAGVDGAGSLAFGLALAGSGIVFAAVAAVAAQLSANARTTRGIAFAVLAATYTLRAIGDARAGNGPTNPLVWMSPQGWSIQVRPLAGDHFAILLLHVVAAVVLIGVAYVLLQRRDLGAGLIAERLGAPAAGPGLSGPFGLSWRLQRGALLAWTVGLALYGLVIGSVVHGIGDELGTSDAINDFIGRLGGSDVLEDSFLSMGYTMLGMAASAYAISAALRLHSEESGQRAEVVLTGAVARIRWAASHLAFAFLGPVVLLVVSGLIGGLVYGAAADDMGKVWRVLEAALVQVPAIWVFAGAAVLLFGLLPRWSTVAWGVFTAGVALFLLGSISGMPQWVQDLTPYSHLPKVPGTPFTATPVVILVILAAVLTTVGLIAFRRRDLR
ncbi:ABC-2 type transport system permease protein [Nocardia transvalensis]|uniref:ABC-2 type transport system permease protein n=1 Tax=Nocardia transvalensis TaxID=37333 RepID=A0A7W9PAJ1_9NOCA|nr:ABC transporter permease [Nocardia transvalensis]MBB5912470.1 ABC-2 type transport system permease protein [Nocardia transvalensis]